MKRLLAVLAIACPSAFIGCTVVASGEALSEGCPEGAKPCDGRCVSDQDEEFGCGRASCSPCALVNAVAGCSAEGECIVASCVGSWEDCDRDPETGCEINLEGDVDHCGACDAACGRPTEGEAACAQAECYVRACEDPYVDCNFDYKDGCEANIDDDAENCGACGAACDAGETCESGVCQARR